MNTRHLLDPELAMIFDQLPVSTVSLATLAVTRQQIAQQTALINAAAPAFPHLQVSQHHVQGPAGAPDVRLLLYRPLAATAPLAALLWIHGGGYVAGSPDWDDQYIKGLATELGCCIASVDYRLAPETPFPGPVEDCYAALQWLHGEATKLGVDAARIGIAGLSAGGGLCAALGLLARDRGKIKLCFQAPLQPMLDDRAATAAYEHPFAGEFIWKKAHNEFGWSAMLGHEPGLDGVSPYAAAARADDLSGLPPTYIAVGAIDLFVEEDIDYARRLMRAGVSTELHVYPGACHGFNLLAPEAQVSKAYRRDLIAALRRGLGIEPAQATSQPALMQQLATMLPGIPTQDLGRFARSLSVTEPYGLGAGSLHQDGVPRGKLTVGRCAPGIIYPGVAHDYQVYVPQQYDGSQPAMLMVFQDGARYLGPELNAVCVLDQLIATGAIAPTVAVFVQPGEQGPGLPIYGGSDNRSVEYDSLGDAYARFLLDELLPVATQGLNISDDPAQRAICGLSSGGICAFNVAWERPDAFGLVVSHCGSFVNIRGGHQLASHVRQAPKKSLRVFLQTGENDLNIVFGDWLNANHELASAMTYKGYEHQLVVGQGGHSLAHGGAIFPDTMRWLWSKKKP